MVLYLELDPEIGYLTRNIDLRHVVGSEDKPSSDILNFDAEPNNTKLLPNIHASTSFQKNFSLL